MTFPFFETFILSIFDVMQYYFITNKLIYGKLDFRRQHCIGLLLGALSGAIVSVTIAGVYAVFGNTLVFMGLAYYLYKKRGVQLVYLHILGMTLMVTIQFLIIFVLYAWAGKIEYTPSVGMAAQGVGLTIAVLVSRFVPIQLLYRFVEIKNDLFKVISLNIFILLTFCTIYWYLRFEGVVENLISISVIVVIILLINLIFLKEGLKNHVLEEQNHAYERYLPIVSELMDDIRIRQHDFDSHITALKVVLAQKKEAEAAIEKVEDYLQEVESSFENVDLLKMKNQIIAGFLYSKKKQATEEKITLELSINDSALATPLKDYELLEVLSILIDNAFETGVPDNVVRVRFYREEKKSVIEVANKHSYIPMTQLNEFFTKGYSSKRSEKRGLGLYKLKQLISRYTDSLEVTNVNDGENYIVFKVSLPSAP